MQTLDGVTVLRGGRSRDGDLDRGLRLTRSACRRIARALNSYATEQLRLTRATTDHGGESRPGGAGH